MKIDNQKTVYRIWIRKLIFTIVFVASIVLVMFVKVFEQQDTAITKYHLVIAIAVVFIIFSLINMFRNPYYFYFDDINDVLVFRYYPVGFFNSKKNSVQIPKQQFVRYETSRFFLKTQEKLVLYQLYRNKVAKYPPISLSALTKKEREELKTTLSHYSKKK